MKYRDSEITGSGCDQCNVVRTLCHSVNERALDDAYDEYFKSRAHSYALLAESFTNSCRAEIRKVKNGRPSPRPSFCCCRGCFTDMLSEQYEVTYAALDTELDGDDKAWSRVPINDAPDESDAEALANFLTRKCHAEYVTACSPVSADVKRRTAFLEAFRDLMRVSARLAKRLGETEAAKNLLCALGMTLNDSSLNYYDGYEHLAALELRPEVADEIYSTAVLGWRQLWAATEYAALKPLPVKKTSKRKA